MRITQRAVALTSLNGLNRNLDAVAKLQQQLTSGKVLSKPSDSPTGTNQAMQTRSGQAANEQQARNINDASDWLGNTGATMQTMLGTIQRIRDLTVQGLNSGAASGASLQAIATEVASLRESLIGQANQSIDGRPLFGGATGGSKAYDATGAWVGQSGVPINRRISDDEAIRIDLTGPETFGPPGNDLFAVVGRIATDMTTNPTAVRAHLGDLDVALDRMLGAVAEIGSRAKRVEQAEQINSDQALTLQTRLANTENIDLPATIMQLEMQKVGYQAALAATAKAIQPTLLDFLR